MSSLIANSPTQTPNLKGKINQVKRLLDEANRRLQDEASKHEIFTTKTSASSVATMSTAKHNGTSHKQVTTIPPDLRRTISDIGTIQSVLSCPIFNRIVNVTDSLDKLAYHLTLRPSIGPADINIDDSGELILAPPIEPTTLSNYINNQFDGQYSTDHSNSPQLFNQQEFSQNSPVNGGKLSGSNVEQQQPMSIVAESDQMDDYVNSNRSQRDILPQDVTSIKQAAPLQEPFSSQSYDGDDEIKKYAPKPLKANNPHQNKLSSHHQASAYDCEKLVSNGKSSKRNHNASDDVQPEFGMERTRVKSVAAVFENAINGSVEGRRLYKANGNFALNQMVATSKQENIERAAQSSNSNGQFTNEPQAHRSQTLGYSNELYDETQGLSAQTKRGAHRQELSGYDPNCTYANEEARKQPIAGLHNESTQHAPPNERPNRASPSASAGSTVRLADECDSGTSSFRSQAAKGTLYSPQSHKPIEQLDEDPVDNSIDQELIEKLSPEMERIKVTLEKGPEGMGITIAGYTCEQEEISGIFIKGITPGSPADRCGKIKILDQIFAVNGQEILGYSNPEATYLLRKHTGKVVTLELMRYLSESRYQKLQNLLEDAAPAPNLKKSVVPNQIESNGNHAIKPTLTMSSRLDSSRIPTSISAQNANIDQSSSNEICSARTKTAQQQKKPTESIYKNSPVLEDYEPTNGAFGLSGTSNNSQSGSRSPIPVAAQRYSGSTSKIIETKQGARNTIDIRSPMCQTTATATYVNKVIDIDVFDSSARSPTCMAGGLRQQAPVELTKGGSEPEWERDVEIVELQRDSSSQGLGFTVKEYNDPKDQKQSIIMITSITPGGIAEINGKLSLGDLLVFVDDKSLEGASLNEAVKALKETNGQVRLGVLKLRR